MMLLEKFALVAGMMLLASMWPAPVSPAYGSRQPGDEPPVAKESPAQKSATPAPQPKRDEIWLLVAESKVIATGTLGVPVESIRAHLSSKKHDYVELTVHRDESLKGEHPVDFKVRWFTKPVRYSPDPEHVIELDGKKVLLFLVKVDKGSTKGLYFAAQAPGALVEADAKRIEEVRREIMLQKELLARFQELAPPEKEPLYRKVKELIDAATSKETQMDAFRQLEDLGPKAVPAIIMLMDDHRDLAIPRIALSNPPKAWEAIRQYSPKKVVDAMSAILNQLTGQTFGDIESGGSEMERKETVDGWRIYMLKTAKR